MTADELRSHFNTIFGLNPWPKTYEVDADTYENCLAAVEDWQDKNRVMLDPNGIFKGKLMFKGVELILKS